MELPAENHLVLPRLRVLSSRLLLPRVRAQHVACIFELRFPFLRRVRFVHVLFALDAIVWPRGLAHPCMFRVQHLAAHTKIGRRSNALSSAESISYLTPGPARKRSATAEAHRDVNIPTPF
jgi:hypothetical protein